MEFVQRLELKDVNWEQTEGRRQSSMLISIRDEDPAAVWFSTRNKRPRFVFEIMNGYPASRRCPPQPTSVKPPQQN